MSSLSQFIGGRKIATAVNNFSQGSTQLAGLSGMVAYGKNYATTAQTANTLRDILNISAGRGALNWCGVYTTDSTSKTLRLKITIDGTVIFDGTSSTMTSGSPGIVAIGATNGTPQPVVFRTSCRVEMASSVASDTQATTVINYETDA